MKTRMIGDLGVSVVGLGCNNFGWHIDQAQTQRVVDAALEVGITLFDTAEMYGDGDSETMLGRALGRRRDEVVIATKFGHGDQAGRGSKAYIDRAVEKSLRRLDTDRIDIYYLHQPDPSVPIADTLHALQALVEQGKVRQIACSNFSAEQLREAETVGGTTRFAAVQNHYSLLDRSPEAEVLPACRELGLAFVPYFPLESGLLTGKYRKGQVPEGSRLAGKEGSHFDGMGDRLLTEENLDRVEALIEFSQQRGHSILELAFSWLLAHDPVASVIAGATKPEQVRSNAAAAGWALSDEERAEVDRLTGA